MPGRWLEDTEQQEKLSAADDAEARRLAIQLASQLPERPHVARAAIRYLAELQGDFIEGEQLRRSFPKLVS